MLSTVKKYASKACALAAAVALCCSIALFSFLRPSVPVKADFGDYASAFEYGFLSTFGSGVTVATASDASFGAALGSQLALFMISQQCEQERAAHPGATYDFSSFEAVTGFYQISGDDKYYPLVFCHDKNFNNNFQDGRYVGLDGGLLVADGPHFRIKLFPSSNASSFSMGYSTSGSSAGSWFFQANGTGTISMGVDFIPKQNNDFFTDRTASYSRSSGFSTYFRLSNVNVFSASGNNITIYPGFRQYTNASPVCGWPSQIQNYPIPTDLPAITVDPENFPVMYDTLIEEIPVPYRIFPDGFPVEEPTEETTEETTESDDDQPFTLPPEWLETYPVPEIPDPSIPYPSDAEPPTINYEIQRNGLNFWADLWTELIDKTGLGSYVVILLGLSILEWILWHAGNGGNGKGGEQ